MINIFVIFLMVFSMSSNSQSIRIATFNVRIYKDRIYKRIYKDTQDYFPRLFLPLSMSGFTKIYKDTQDQDLQRHPRLFD